MILIIKRGIDDFNPIDSRIQISFNLKDGYIQMSYICKRAWTCSSQWTPWPTYLSLLHDCTDLPANKCEKAELKFND